MKIKVYSIYDSKSQVYNTPFFQVNEQVALRTSVNLVCDPKTAVSRNPEDFTLFEIGEYDDGTGTFHNHRIPIPLVCFDGSDIKSGDPEIKKRSVASTRDFVNALERHKMTLLDQEWPFDLSNASPEDIQKIKEAISTQVS